MNLDKSEREDRVWIGAWGDYLYGTLAMSDTLYSSLSLYSAKSQEKKRPRCTSGAFPEPKQPAEAKKRDALMVRSCSGCVCTRYCLTLSHIFIHTHTLSFSIYTFSLPLYSVPLYTPSILRYNTTPYTPYTKIGPIRQEIGAKRGESGSLGGGSLALF